MAYFGQISGGQIAFGRLPGDLVALELDFDFLTLELFLKTDKLCTYFDDLFLGISLFGLDGFFSNDAQILLRYHGFYLFLQLLVFHFVLLLRRFFQINLVLLFFRWDGFSLPFIINPLLIRDLLLKVFFRLSLELLLLFGKTLDSIGY